MNILTVNLLLSTLVFATAAWLYVRPKLDEWEPRTVLLPILLLHSLRHLGLMFLAPGAVYPGLAPQFTYPAAFGDFLAAVLAFIAIPAVATRARASPSRWSGCSTSRDRSTCCSRSRSPPSTTRRL
jgi:hypothetical protein